MKNKGLYKIGYAIGVASSQIPVLNVVVLTAAAAYGTYKLGTVIKEKYDEAQYKKQKAHA